MPQTCSATRKDGGPCETQIVGDAPLCFGHDPAMRERRLAASRTGGENRSTAKRLSKLLPARLVPVFALLEEALSATLAGTLDPRQATAAAARARAMATVLSAGEVEERLRKLEEGAA